MAICVCECRGESALIQNERNIKKKDNGKTGWLVVDIRPDVEASRSFWQHIK